MISTDLRKNSHRVDPLKFDSFQKNNYLSISYFGDVLTLVYGSSVLLRP